MNRKSIYMLSLIGFFLMWGVFGFMATAPRGESVVKEAVLPQENTRVASVATANAAIPVTGETRPVAGIVFVYALLGVGALFLILALLNAANKKTMPYAHRKEPADKS